MIKTYGYLIAVETPEKIDPKVIEAAVKFHLENNNPPYKFRNIDVECMGEIDVYPGESGLHTKD